MKLAYGNGKVFEVRDVGPVLYRLKTKPNGPPIKFNGYQIVDDDAARDLLRDLIATRLYERDHIA